MKIDGYKTYLAGLGFIAYGLYQIYQGHADPGVQSILGGFGLLGLRHAVAKGKTNA